MTDRLLKQRTEAARAKLIDQLKESVRELPLEQRQIVIIEALVKEATAGGYALEGEVDAAIELLAEFPREVVTSALNYFGESNKTKKDDVAWVKRQLVTVRSRLRI